MRPVQAQIEIRAPHERPRLRHLFRDYALPLLLLLASIVTTTVNGARFMQNFLEGLPPVAREADLWPWPWLLRHPALFSTGFAYSLTLLSILFVHEYGHYAACTANRMRATLPWVIPAPTLSGTFGAIIRIRTRIPSRNALMDVGIYGPLAGFIASAIAVAVGLVLSVPRPPGASDSVIRFGGDPLTIHFSPRSRPLVPRRPLVQSFLAAPHPCRRLDRSLHHCAQSHPRRPARRRTHPLCPLAAPASPHDQSPALPPLPRRYHPWGRLALLVVFLLIPALRHPKVPIDSGLSPGRAVLGILGLALFVLTFTPTPFYDNSLLQLLNIDPFTAIH